MKLHIKILNCSFNTSKRLSTGSYLFQSILLNFRFMKYILLVIFFSTILFRPSYAKSPTSKENRRNINNIKQVKKDFEKWQTDPNEFAKLFYGDNLTLRPQRKDPTYIHKPEIKKKVIGSYIEWQAKYGINPGWFGMSEKGKRLISGNATIFSLLGDDKVGYIHIGGSRVEGEKEIDNDEMTWGIPPNADLNIKMKLKSVSSAVILRNGILMIIVDGSELTINSLSEKCDWPPYDKKFDMFQAPFGPSNLEVHVSNTFGLQVKVGLRSEEKGIDFIVPTTGSSSVSVPKGKYEIYFHYSVDPLSLYKGDSFELTSSGIEIKLGKTSEGNYNVKKVK